MTSSATLFDALGDATDPTATVDEPTVPAVSCAVGPLPAPGGQA